MNVKNDFPNADIVLGKLRGYVSFFKEKLKTAEGQDVRKYQLYIDYATRYTSAIAAYLDSVCNDQQKIQNIRNKSLSREEIQEFIQRLDDIRTRNHSEIITTMILIDRTANKFGLSRVFGCASDYEKDFTCLTPLNIDEKRKMTPEQRIKRREMGNFGLYMAASATAGMSKKYMITDDDARNFADCEGERRTNDIGTVDNIIQAANTLKHNMNDILDIG